MRKKETDIEKVRETFRAFAWLPFEPDRGEETGLPLVFISHPLTNCAITAYRDESGLVTLNLFDEEDARTYRDYMSGLCERRTDPYQIVAMLQKQYRLCFLKYIKSYLSKRDFSGILKQVWIESENPNMDKNVSVKELCRWFKSAEKESLMEKSELSYLESLPERVQVYRGVSVGRNPDGLSWTDNPKVAEWFAHRFDKKSEKGFVRTGFVNKKNILAYFSDRSEKELVIDCKKIENISVL